MYVFCCGMYRSASTWSFNVCRDILRVPGRLVVGAHSPSFTETLSELSDPPDHLVYKSHHLDALPAEMLSKGEAKAVYTHRDPLDAIASGMRFLNVSFEKMFEYMAESIRTLEQLMAMKRGLLIGYEEVGNDTFNQVRRIAAYLEQPLSVSAMDAIVARNTPDALKAISDSFDSLPAERIITDPANRAYDRETLLHRNHFQGGKSGQGYGQLGHARSCLVYSAFAATLKRVRPDFGQVPENDTVLSAATGSNLGNSFIQ